MSKEKEYSELFRNIVAPHLHKIVEIIKSHNLQKKYIGNGQTEFDSLLGAEYSWSIFFDFSNTDSDYVARLSFWIGGLREKFSSDLNKKKCIRLLNEIFNASILAYFEFNIPNEIYRETRTFCSKVDIWMGEKILSKRFEEFTLIGKPLIIITDMITLLRSEYKDLVINIPIKKNLRTEIEIKREIKQISRQVITECLEYEKRNINLHLKIAKHLDSFISKIKSEGYNDLINTELKHKIEGNTRLYAEMLEERKREEEKAEKEEKIRLEEERIKQEEEKKKEDEEEVLKKYSLIDKIKCFFDYHNLKLVKKYWDYNEYKCTRCNKIVKE